MTMHEGDFPILRRKVHGKRLVYLDNAATTQKPKAVLDAMTRFYEESNANIHRGIYKLSEEATAQYEAARAGVARLLNAPSPENIVFSSGTTEGINMVAYGWGLANLKPGDEILVTPLEHHANIVPWQQAAARTGARLVYCDLHKDFTLDVESLKSKINSKTKLLAITHVSNVLGIAMPLFDIIPYAKRKGVVVLVDGAQAVPHLPVDVQALGCDFYVFSGHKMLGPTGIGVLYLSQAHFGMEPYRTGGDMIDDVREQETDFAADSPRRFESGTPNIAGAVGLGAAVAYLEGIGLGEIHEHEKKLLRLAWKRLSEIRGVTLYGPAPENDSLLSQRSAIVPFNIEGIHPHDVAQLLDSEGVAIRSGKHCAHPLLARMGLAAVNRASFYLYNNEDDVDALVLAIKKAQDVFQ
jgi:cysteine desulfurase / selenocysteine lyase